MPAAVKTSVTELPESRVRVEAEVPPEEVERRMQATARQLGQNLRMPGFRKGKVPPPVVIQRIGRESVLDETVRGAMGRWYLDAIDAAGIHPVGDPDLDVGDLPGEGQPLTFTIEIGVRPAAALGEYKGVEVGKREAGADEAAVDAEVEALRERSARLETAEGAAADNGDFVVMDYVGSIDGENFAGGEERDQLVELGSGRLVPGFEEQLAGARAGDERTVTVNFPDDYGAAELAGKEAHFAVTVKEIKRKDLPALDDDFASDAAGFDTLAELREDIAAKLREADESRVEAEFREAVIAAVIEAEGIEPSEGDILDALQTTATREGTTPEKLRARLEKAGRLDDLREDLAQRAAIDLLAENAAPISVEQAQARDKLWTPGRQGSDDAPSRLWTPGARD